MLMLFQRANGDKLTDSNYSQQMSQMCPTRMGGGHKSATCRVCKCNSLSWHSMPCRLICSSLGKGGRSVCELECVCLCTLRVRSRVC